MEKLIDRCGKCPHMQMDRHLQYYPYPYCDVNGKEIHFSLKDGWDRMKWCPLLTKDDRINELIDKVKKTHDEFHEFEIWSTKREEDPQHFMYLASCLDQYLQDAIELLKEGNGNDERTTRPS